MSIRAFHLGPWFNKVLELSFGLDWDRSSGRKAGLNLYSDKGHHKGFHVDAAIAGFMVTIAVYDTRHKYERGEN